MTWIVGPVVDGHVGDAALESALERGLLPLRATADDVAPDDVASNERLLALLRQKGAIAQAPSKTVSDVGRGVLGHIEKIIPLH